MWRSWEPNPTSPNMIPPILGAVLIALEPDTTGTFTGSPPKVTSSSSGKTYYAKLGSSTPHDVEQFAGEAASLAVFDAISPGLAPKVLVHGVSESGRPYMVSEYLDIAGPLSAKLLAKRLATEVHAHSSPNARYGFDVPTFCGVTRFENEWCDTWNEAFGGMIQSMLDRIRVDAQGGSDSDAELSRLGKLTVER